MVSKIVKEAAILLFIGIVSAAFMATIESIHPLGELFIWLSYGYIVLPWSNILCFLLSFVVCVICFIIRHSI